MHGSFGILLHPGAGGLFLSDSSLGRYYFGDTCLAIGSILTDPPLPWSRCHRRSPSKRLSLKHFPRKWMILTGIMINWSRGLYPAYLVIEFIQCTYFRIHRLNALVSLTPTVWYQFFSFKSHVLLNICPSNVEMHSSTLTELG